MERTQDEIMADCLRIQKLHSELFSLANDYSGDTTGLEVAVPLHEVCNNLLQASSGMIDRLKQIL